MNHMWYRVIITMVNMILLRLLGIILLKKTLLSTLGYLKFKLVHVMVYW